MWTFDGLGDIGLGVGEELLMTRGVVFVRVMTLKVDRD